MRPPRRVLGNAAIQALKGVFYARKNLGNNERNGGNTTKD